MPCTVARYKRASCFSLESSVIPHIIPFDFGSAIGDLCHHKLSSIQLQHIFGHYHLEPYIMLLTIYLFPWKSGRTCISSVRAATKGEFLSCIIDSKVPFRSSKRDTSGTYRRKKNLKKTKPDMHAKRSKKIYITHIFK